MKQEVKVRSYFLSGGTGFFGKSLLSLLKRGYGDGESHFTILTRAPAGFLQSCPEFSGMSNVDFVQGDVRDFVFPRGYFDYVIHAGAPAMLMPPGVERDIILRGTERMLSFAKNCGADRFLFISSGGAYGVQPPGLEKIPETFPCHPETEYGIAKFEAEQMCGASGLDFVIARCFAFTGRYLNREIHFAIGNFIRDALAGKSIVIQGDGTPYRSYLHADDLIEWLRVLLLFGRNGEIYNVGSDEAVSVLELAQTVRDVLHGGPVDVRQSPVFGAKASRYVPDITKIQREFNVKITYRLREAILHSLTEQEVHCVQNRA